MQTELTIAEICTLPSLQVAKGTSIDASLAAFNSKRVASSTSADAARALDDSQLEERGFVHAEVEITPEGNAVEAAGTQSWTSDGLSRLGTLGTACGPDGRRVFDLLGQYSVQFHLSPVLPCQAYITQSAQVIPASGNGQQVHLGPRISSPVYKLEVVQPGLGHVNGCTCISISRKARVGGPLEMSLELCMDGQPVHLASSDLQAIRIQSKHLAAR